MSRTIRVGLIGAGANTRLRHIPGFQAIEGVELVSVANRTAASTRAAAEEFGLVAMPDWRTLITDESIDAVCIGTWPYLHANMTVAALEAGKHLLCEARMATDLEEALRMQRAARDHSWLTAQLVPAPVSLRWDEQIVDLLAAGELGELVAVDLEAPGLDPCEAERPMSWREDADFSGQNTMTLGIWYEMIMRWCGTVSGLTAIGRVVRPWRDSGEAPRPILVRDHLEILGEFGQGASLHMRISSAIPEQGVRLCLHGSQASLSFDGQQLLLRKGGDERVIAPSGDDWQVEADFIESIRSGQPVRRTSFCDGLRYMAFTQAVHESVGSGQRVAVPVY